MKHGYNSNSLALAGSGVTAKLEKSYFSSAILLHCKLALSHNHPYTHKHFGLFNCFEELDFIP